MLLQTSAHAALLCECGQPLASTEEQSWGACSRCMDAPIGFEPTLMGKAAAFFLSVRADYIYAVDASRDREDAPDYNDLTVQLASARLDLATAFLRAIGYTICEDCRALTCTCPNV